MLPELSDQWNRTCLVIDIVKWTTDCCWHIQEFAVRYLTWSLNAAGFRLSFDWARLFAGLLVVNSNGGELITTLGHLNQTQIALHWWHWCADQIFWSQCYNVGIFSRSLCSSTLQQRVCSGKGQGEQHSCALSRILYCGRSTIKLSQAQFF